MRQTYWFVCPKCGDGRESQHIENFCEHWWENAFYLMEKRGPVFTIESPFAASNESQEGK